MNREEILKIIYELDIILVYGTPHDCYRYLKDLQELLKEKVN